MARVNSAVFFFSVSYILYTIALLLFGVEEIPIFFFSDLDNKTRQKGRTTTVFSAGSRRRRQRKKSARRITCFFTLMKTSVRAMIDFSFLFLLFLSFLS
ncbi:hypothetical protein V8C35DRAFT_62810 [Trichoderma chlorosporum]